MPRVKGRTWVLSKPRDASLVVISVALSKRSTVVGR